MRVRLVLATIVGALALPGAAQAQGADLTCQFSLTRLDATTTNVLAVDTNAVYWASSYTAVKGTRIRIEGQFPYSRYMSWNLYDPAGRPLTALTDEDIVRTEGAEPVPPRRRPLCPAARLHGLHRGRQASEEAAPQHALHR